MYYYARIDPQTGAFLAINVEAVQQTETLSLIPVPSVAAQQAEQWIRTRRYDAATKRIMTIDAPVQRGATVATAMMQFRLPLPVLVAIRGSSDPTVIAAWGALMGVPSVPVNNPHARELLVAIQAAIPLLTDEIIASLLAA